jgi:MFS family permease
MSCTTAWGAWFAELFPPRLRAHGAALFHVGHILALASPLMAAYIAERMGLTSAMSMAAVVYVAGALLWFVMPETQKRRRLQAVPPDIEPAIPLTRTET